MAQTLHTLSSSPAPPTPPPATICRPHWKDRDALHALVAAVEAFNSDEIRCACELIDLALAEPDGDYRLLIAASDTGIRGYVCYGPTPMTTDTWDLYWIATHPSQRGHGVATLLSQAMEGDIRRHGGRRVRVETSRQHEYAQARRFYERNTYQELASIADFYRPGDDLLILIKLLEP